MARKLNNDPPRLTVVAGNVEPEETGRPDKPASIVRDEVASAVWDQAVSGIRPQEAELFKAYCLNASRVDRLQQELAKLTDLFVESEGGAVKTHPVIGSLNSAERLLGMQASRLGLTPVDRSRVKTTRSDSSAAKSRKLGKYIK